MSSKEESILVGVIGGSGVYDLDGLTDVQEKEIDTPFGFPSDAIRCGKLNGIPVAFLPRHGRNHSFTPTAVPYRANIYALRSLGVQRLLSVSAVGSLCEEYAPGDFVLVDQFIDRTYRRVQTFFDSSLVAHLPWAHPVCQDMVAVVTAAAKEIGVQSHQGGTYVCIEGPQFSSQAESELFRSWGAKIVGMTNGTESKLAREAGMSWCCIAMVTDYDCWHPDHDDVDVATVIATAQANAKKVRGLVAASVPRIAALGLSPWPQVVAKSVMSTEDHTPTKQLEILKVLAGHTCN